MSTKKKTCSKCGGDGPFNKSSANPDGLQRWCRACQSNAFAACYAADPKKYTARKKPTEVRAYYRTYRRKHRERLVGKRRMYHLTHAYALTLAEYDALLQAQEGRCAICRNPETRQRNGALQRLSVDHDHATGAVRGLLCSNCNNLLGHAHDDVGVLDAAMQYLSRSTPQKQQA